MELPLMEFDGAVVAVGWVWTLGKMKIWLGCVRHALVVGACGWRFILCLFYFFFLR